MPKFDSPDAPPLDHDEQYIEVWNDLVSAGHLTWSLICCAATTAIALLIATALSANLFLWGLGGSVIGFIVCAVLISPKRDVRIVGDDDLADDSSAALAEAGSTTTTSAS
ncbi:hypothetical protein [Tessaracoccus caeni]|uniref:hypothetical protein n=1 Tax=Tessaracoccus caeni TaxID=3031239 RepID=UPI0023DC2703|nr:hypothetical protein [Tessaracoccus caeni]MDF1488607.1 hypothetical protein [Tessaracoccus caeni]